ncbi:transglycosylase SLT domain-containing protein [Streptomyces sp. NPDC096080]|uniref:transglycosylase SLT domain-containing protein n=1 Tax=Streptomyces sp. NPDC096080 TaxID=3156693 RepID=UPI0033230297
MPKNISFRDRTRALTRRHKIAVAGVATLGAAALAFSAVPGNAEPTTSEAASQAQTHVAYSTKPIKDVKASVTDQLASASLKAEAAKAKAASKAAAHKKAEAAAKKKAEAAHKAKTASRSAERAAVKPAAAKTYSNNLHGWISESLDIMKAKGIPGSYNGLYRNIMRESSGNPNAINGWDINAINGVPSKGLLQVIPPTFKAYHVKGTSSNIYDPVANITAAANSAADKYGTIDNVNSAY